MNPQEVFLSAGDFYFHHAKRDDRTPMVLRTLLGSCVSVVLWHPASASGGMCHAILPSPSRSNADFDGNHCDGAMRLFMREINRLGFPPSQYKAFLMGGARMSMGMRDMEKVSVGERNIAQFRHLLGSAGFSIAAEHAGQSGARRIKFHVNDGRIEVLHNNKTVLLAQ